MISNSNMAAILIWRLENNIAAIMQCQIIPQNTVNTWRIHTMKISATQIKQTNRLAHKDMFFGIPGSVIHQTKKRLNSRA